MPEMKRQLRERRERADAARMKRAMTRAKKARRIRLAQGEAVGSDFSPPCSQEDCVAARETLDDDCLMQFMEHTRLTPDLENMLAMSNRCRYLWENEKESILKGMQLKQFPEYLEIFGELGHQTEEHIQNLLCAHETDFDRYGSGIREPERHSFTAQVLQNVDWYERCFIIYLGFIDDEFDDQVTSLHQLGIFDSSSSHITKVALITLWRMGWFFTSATGESWPDRSLDVFRQQPEEIRHRMRDIIGYLSCKTNDNLGLMSEYGEEWIEETECFDNAMLAVQPYDPRQWVEEAINGILTVEIITRGIETDIADLTRRHRRFIPIIFRGVLASRWEYDETGWEPEQLVSLNTAVHIAEELGVNIFGE